MLYIFCNNKNLKLKRRKNTGDKRAQQINGAQERREELGKWSLNRKEMCVKFHMEIYCFVSQFKKKTHKIHFKN